MSGIPKSTGAHPSTVSSFMYNILLLLFTVAIASYLIFLLSVYAQRKRPLSSSPPGSKPFITLPPSGNSLSHQLISPIGPLKASPQGTNSIWWDPLCFHVNTNLSFQEDIPVIITEEEHTHFFSTKGTTPHSTAVITWEVLWCCIQ